MDALYIILFVLSFVGGQVLLLYCLRTLDRRLNRRAEDKLNDVLKKKNGNTDEDVVE